MAGKPLLFAGKEPELYTDEHREIILDILEENRAAASFFLVGKNILPERADIVRRAKEAAEKAVAEARVEADEIKDEGKRDFVRWGHASASWEREVQEYIYDFVIKMYPHDELVSIGKEHNSVRFHTPTGTLIFCSYHPSAFIKTSSDIYDGVMYHYRAFLDYQSKMK